MSSIYCMHCGKKNEIKERVTECTLCGKNLYEKEHVFLSYLKEKVKDKFTGEIKDNIFGFLKALIQKYLYGIVVSISVVFTITGVTLNLMHSYASEGDTTTEKYVFQELTDAQKILGCYILEGENKYYSFYPNDRLKISSTETGTENEYYYGIGRNEEGQLYLKIETIKDVMGSLAFLSFTEDGFIYPSETGNHFTRTTCNIVSNY